MSDRRYRQRIVTCMATIALALSVLLAQSVAIAQGASPERRQGKGSRGTAPVQRFIQEGIEVTMSMEHLDAAKGMELHEGDDVRFTFSISDTVSRTGVSGSSPAAWLLAGDRSSLSSRSAAEKVAACLNANLLERPALDLNVFYVLVLNDDATVTVVDPMFHYGSTNLLALVQLESQAVDWAAGERAKYIYLSMPRARKIAVVSTDDWRVEKTIALPGEPSRLALTPDGAYLWAAYADPATGSGGVAAIRAADATLAATMPTGGGDHDIAISDDGRYIYVANRGAGSVSVIDGLKLRKIADVPVAGAPSSIAYSSMAHAAYAIDSASGIVTVIDGRSHRAVARVSAGEGIAQIRFAPGGRLAFIVHPGRDRVAILDAALNRVVQNARVDEEPTGVYFSDRLAYIRHAKSESVLMIPIDGVGTEGNAVPVVDFPGGQLPPGRFRNPSLADGIVKAPGSGAMLVANPLDKTIYYYMEGMAAPMGEFSNFGREARAVMVVDRSLKEVRPGVYQTVARLPRGGHYDIPFFLDAPRLTHSFSLDVIPSDSTRRMHMAEAIGPVAVEHLTKGSIITTATPFTLRFRLTDLATGRPLTGAADVGMVSILAPGLARLSDRAVETSEPGVYELSTEYTAAGAYYLYITCPSHGLSLDNPQFRVVRAIDKPITHDHKEEH